MGKLVFNNSGLIIHSTGPTSSCANYIDIHAGSKFASVQMYCKINQKKNASFQFGKKESSEINLQTKAMNHNDVQCV